MKYYTKAQISTKASNQETDFVAVASTAIEDRHGEIVSPEGWDVKKFKEDPVLLWAHDHHELAVGQAKKIWIEGEGKKAKLMIEGFIHEFTDKAKALKHLVREGIIKTMSVGFRPLEMDGDTFLKQELLEVSFVNVPANPQALISAYKSLEQAGFEKKTIAEVGIPVALLDKMESMDNRIKEVESWVKELKPSAPSGRYSKVIRERQSMAKVIATASDKLLVSHKNATPVNKTKLIKVIKRASENLISSHKKELKNGKN